ncbi:MAG TPA: SUMF1/EgtB/PvdO family nonheme iron enzyme [Ramlibacter sp.]|nr:SUMF1/EgtB/PvdO family nonheme iron enzyme [Ramlibacter sp.]
MKPRCPLLALVLLTAAAAIAQDMVRIPEGAFTMGRDDGPEDERPAHTVHLRAFEIDRLPVTNAQLAAFLQQHGAVSPTGRRYYDWDDNDARIHRVDGRWRADPGHEDHPAVEASWHGAVAYCGWLGKRLPTEAEWEKAARGTDRRPYPWGEAAPTAAHARFGAGWNQTAPAGAFAAGASPYGVQGMAGNAWQWVSSAYRPYPYSATDGREDLEADVVRGTRGGGHDAAPAQLRTTERGRTVSRGPNAGHHNIGFRCAR